MAVINRKNAAGEDVLYFVCRTYQRFTKAGVCSSHAIKESVVTEAVLAKVREVCEAYLKPNDLQPVAEDAVNRARCQERHEVELREVQQKIGQLTAHLEKMYMDRLSGLLAEEDFARIYRRLREERDALEKKRAALQARAEEVVKAEEQAEKLVKQFVQSACTNRELLVSLIERVELTEDKRIIIRFRFQELRKTE